jgi:hypothetical protein
MVMLSWLWSSPLTGSSRTSSIFALGDVPLGGTTLKMISAESIGVGLGTGNGVGRPPSEVGPMGWEQETARTASPMVKASRMKVFLMDAVPAGG